MVDVSKFKDIYVSEVEDHIQKLNDNLLKLEKEPSSVPLLDELMRSSHTMKSSSAAMGYVKLAYLTHVMEDVFDLARNKMLEITPGMMNELFTTLDALEESFNYIKKKDKELDLDFVTEGLKAKTGVKTEGFGKSVRDASNKPIVEEVKKDVASLFTVDEKSNEIEPAPKPEEVKEFDAVAKTDFIKVPVDRLDVLMDLMEELIIDRMSLVSITREYSTTVHPITAKLKPLVEHLNTLVSSIQYQVMQTRLVPVEQIFARFPRLIRDLAVSMKKEIDLEVVGGGIEMDRTMVDKLGEPIVHLIKNAADHGIQTKGKIVLRASREKEFTFISVEDDGLGVDWKKVGQMAVKRGIVSVEPTEKSELEKLLFHSKLSTKEVITETSGRGIGLGVVNEFVLNVGGRVVVESPLSDGKGARITMVLPSTLAIINALLVKVYGDTYAIPFASIDKTVEVPVTDIKSMADQDVAVVDKKNVPLVRIKKLFGLENGEAVNNKKEKEMVVLVQRGKETAGIVIDRLISQEEIIVKPLAQVLKKTKGFSGSTILGDGKTVLIIDVNSLLDDTSKLVR